MHFILALAISHVAAQIAPPFVRKWTFQTGEFSQVLEVRLGKIWYASKKSVGEVDAATGKAIWISKPAKWINPASIDAHWIYAVGQDGKQYTVFAVDRSTGVAKKVFQTPLQINALAGDGRRVYTILGKGTLRALDLAGGKTIWTKELTGGDGLTLSSLYVAGHFVHVGLESSRMALDAADGRILWKRSAQSAYHQPIPLGGSQILVSEGSELVRQDLANGQILWKSPASFEGFGISKDIIIGEQNSSIVGADLGTGRTLWTKPGGEEGYTAGSDEALNIGSAAGVWVSSGNKLRLFDRTGTVRWEVVPPFRAQPVYADARILICAESDRILGYRHGSLPAIPTSVEGRRTLAIKLVRDYEVLDEAERARIGILKAYSFKPMLNKFSTWAKAYGKDRDNATYDLYSLIESSRRLLYDSFDKTHTAEVSEALKDIGPKNSWSSILETILQDKGDQTLYIPGLIAKLESGNASGNLWEASTVEIVARSTDPRAVAFMIATLRNPKANSEFRQQAFRHLAGTGGEAGVAAVRDAGPKAGPRKPWTELAKPETGRRAPKPVTAQDSKGRSWTLFASGVLGHFGDQFMVREGEKPVFLGFHVEGTFGAKAPTVFRGQDISKLMAGDWVKVFPDDPETLRDTDGDGLTDLVEARLGTDPKLADTDGDGLPDAIDPCPNAAPRTLSDEEKIIAASVEARFFEEDWGAPGVISVEGIRPFEMYGYSGTLMWFSGDTPLTSVYGGGVNQIGFNNPNEKAKQVITFGPTRTTATTLIRRYSGGLDGDGTQIWLKKIGDDWFVTDMRILFVS